MDSVIQMLPPSLRRWSTYIDFQGQQKAERIFQVIIVLASVIGFVVGYVMQQLCFTYAIIGIGFVVANLVCLPPWGAFRHHSITWLPIAEEAETKKDTKKRQ